ncbi:hypothetical protein K443DRAFT_632252, partial [Laccaria amethystina LaAM-08-1]
LTTHTLLQTRRESAHPVPHQTRPPPLHQSPLTKIPTKPPENPQNHPSTHGNNPAPRINHPRRRNRPTKIRNRWNPAPRPIDEDPVPLSKPTPTLQPAKTLAPPARRLPLRPTRPRPPRPHVDTQM